MPEVSTSPARGTNTASVRLRVVIRGAVQGVGFRPFVYRLATEMGLSGWVSNSAQGVFVEAEGDADRLRRFLLRLEAERPPRAFIQSLEPSFLDAVGYRGFQVRPSEESGTKTAYVLPDIATCEDCLREIRDPTDRRFRYPFTNCTNCGPRYTILRALPYDRANTTMARFRMCDACRAEYENPLDRRFHAQPNACPDCGPHLELWSSGGGVLHAHHDALLAAAQAIRDGKVVAVKGLGGFHLVVDARQEEAVQRLRRAKAREEKPFALMLPTLEMVRECCELGELEERLLRAPEAPIVLLRRRFLAGSSIMNAAPSVAPGNPFLGVMLPYTPVHHLLLGELGFPVVATSGNRSDEPICTDEQEALSRLAGIADCYLVHNRPIHRHVDDSIVRVLMDRELVLRRARGYAPLPVRVREPLPASLAVGAHLKSAVAVARGGEVFLSQHIGDLETEQAFDAFTRVARDLGNLYGVRPEAVGCDLHPDYLSTQYAVSLGVPVVTVQHHHAHVLACMAENELEGPVLGVSWDGTGFGPDGTIWGGEFLRVAEEGFRRVAHLRAFPLPGGEKAVKEPRRVALGLLYELLGDEALEMDDLPPVRAFTAQELAVLRRMLDRGTNTPRTSSAGRLFDAVAGITGLRQLVRHEGQAAMELEFALEGALTEEGYRVDLVSGPEGEAGDASPAVLDWGPMVRELIEDWRRGDPPAVLSARFHNGLVEAIVKVALAQREGSVVLTGGCFQNRYLTERAVHRLGSEGLRPYWHQRIPPNDGGIALGQALAVSRRARRGRTAGAPPGSDGPEG